MKKGVKVLLIILIMLLGIILIDTIQAKLFNNSPLIKMQYNRDGGNVDYVDEGIFVYTYVFTNREKVTVFKWESYAPILDVGDPIIENEITDVEFVRTYHVISNLNMTDTTGKYNFYVIQQFQIFEPIVIKVDKKYTLEENTNYEFTFKGNKEKEKEYTLQDIFDTFEIENIEKTDKVGLDQRQDEI